MSSTSTTAPPPRDTLILPRSAARFPLDDLGLEHYGLDTSGRTPPYPRDGRLRIADGLYAVGDAAGPELHTHQAHYQGELAARMAMGETVDARLPRAPARDLHRPRGGIRGCLARRGE